MSRSGGKPWGVAAVITPWNFPFAVPLWMLGPSFSGRKHGNLQAVRRHRLQLASAWSSCFVEAGFPEGTINLVHGEGATGEALVRDPGVNLVLFTGSYEVGKRIQLVSAEFPIALSPVKWQQERCYRLRRLLGSTWP